jgi:hypothetical protein
LPPGTPLIANLATRGDGFEVSLRDLTPVKPSVLWPEILARRVNTASSPRSAIELKNSGEKASSPRPQSDSFSTETSSAAPEEEREKNRAEERVVRSAQSTLKGGHQAGEWTGRILDGVYSALDRIERGLEQDQPKGRIELGKLSRNQENYFFCRDHLKKVERLAQAVERSREQPKRMGTPMKVSRARPLKIVLRQQYTSVTPRFDRKREAIDLRDDLADLDAEKMDLPDSPLTALLRELALLEALAMRPIDDRPVLLMFRACLEADRAAVFRLGHRYAQCLEQIAGNAPKLLFEPQDEGELMMKLVLGERAGRAQGLYINGTNVRRLLPGDSTILTRRANGGMGIVLMTIEKTGSVTEATAVAKKRAEEIDALEPDVFGPVIQMLVENEALTDFRSGIVISAEAPVEEMKALMLSSLKMPKEVEEVLTKLR